MTRDEERLLRELEERMEEIKVALVERPVATFEKYREMVARYDEAKVMSARARKLFLGDEDQREER